MPEVTMRPPIRITQQDVAIRDHALDIVCQVCGDVTPEEVLSKARSRRVSFARYLAMSLLSPKAGMTTSKVGMLFDRDHASVTHAVQVISDIRRLPQAFPKEIEIINRARELHTSWI